MIDTSLYLFQYIQENHVGRRLQIAFHPVSHTLFHVTAAVRTKAKRSTLKMQLEQ